MTKSVVMLWRDKICDSDLSSTTKLVALVLSIYANGRGVAFPGRATLASSASLTTPAIDAALEWLERDGWLLVEPPRKPIHVREKGGTTKTVLRRPGGKSASNRYTLSFPDTANVVPSLGAHTANVVSSLRGPNRKPDALNRQPDALNSKRRLHESVESAEVGAGAAPAAPPALPIDECWECHQLRPLVDDFYCQECRAELGPDAMPGVESP
jgi:hypothetical protein